ncbi:MAG: hypothetical protein ABIF85_01655 [Nanoarchaeota archaeon]
MKSTFISGAGKTNAASNMAKISFLFIFAMFLAVSASPAFATHISSAELEPEWSAAGKLMNYTVTYYNNASSIPAIGEVRIYNNDNYENFSCGLKTGWILSEPAPGICNYYGTPKNVTKIVPGGSEFFTFSAKTPEGGCEWVWQFETRDLTYPNASAINYLSDTTSVDDKKPMINKTVIGTQLGTCPPGQGDNCWITTSTQINITVNDQGDCGISGLDFCSVAYTVDGGGAPVEKTYQKLNGALSWNYLMNFDENSVHALNVTCYDVAGNQLEDIETFKVDSEKPTTTKTYVGTQYPNPIGQTPYPHWINSSTLVYLDAVDGYPAHASGINKTYWRNTLIQRDGIPYNMSCESNDACQDMQGYGNWSIYQETGAFHKNEDSCHLIEYYSVDNLGNEETVKKQCVFVDNTPPVVSKTVGEPKKDGSNFGAHWLINSSTPITLTCTDPQPHPVNHNVITYRYFVDGTLKKDWTVIPSGQPFTFPEESNHTLEYKCADALGNTGQTFTEVDIVDNTPPAINMTIGQPQVGECPADDNGDKCYIRDNTTLPGTPVTFNVTDTGVHKTGINRCDWSYTVNGQEVNDDTEYKFPFNITFPEDSTHVLTVKCYDNIGNMNQTVQTFLVDSIPPVTNKTYGMPYKKYGYSEWINSSTPVYLNATDAKVGVDKLYWRNTIVADQYCLSEFSGCQLAVGNGSWNAIDGNYTTIYKPEESCHLIEFYSKDRLGNTESVKKQCVFVDNTPPVTTKTIGNPNVVKGNETYISNITTITLTCNDLSPHPVGNEKGYYRYFVNGTLTRDWTAIPSGQPFTFPEDSNHTLEYYCVDGLGNTEQVQSEVDIVDSKAPIITTSIVGPTYYNATEGRTYIDGVTKIHVEAFDPQPHPVEGVTCDWFYTVRENTPVHGGNTSVTVPFDINFPEESTHDLTITCRDALGNSASDYKTYVVDKTAPNTTKSYGTPKYNNGTSEWITSQTNVSLSVQDAGTHKSGIKETKYRVTRLGVGDENNAPCSSNSVCQQQNVIGDWKAYLSPFNVGETSCHLIEYYSVDNVNKTETSKKTCVFVDNTAPAPNKTIGEPKTKWDGVNVNEQNISYEFYPNLPERCWSNSSDGIDCWKTTTLAPITLSCTDVSPHPVGHSKIAFSINFDNMVNLTAEYCNYKDGFNNINGTMVNGFCVVDRDAPITIRFRNESNHNLKFYCTDALGNKGPIDDEMFKIEGTWFNIYLFPKFNLISVPFNLLNSSIEEVFKNVKDNISSVWSYDNGVWLTWTPGASPDTLHNIRPGYGYWVLAKNESNLILGGSLFSPISLPPSRNLPEGWSLIGPYGTEWQSYQKDPYCPYNDAKPSGIYADYAYCALNSLVDIQGNPGWSGLWTYASCGNSAPTSNPWKGINACTNSDKKNKMVTGYGYWVLKKPNAPNIYAPASVCKKSESCVYFTPA